MAKTAKILMGALMASSLFAQAPVRGTALASVRIVSEAAWQRMQGFNAMSEVRLHGVVEQVDGAVLRLRMAFGTVRVELGEVAQAQALRAGEALEVVAAKIMANGGQRLLATEVLPQA